VFTAAATAVVEVIGEAVGIAAVVGIAAEAAAAIADRPDRDGSRVNSSA
jgi:hypothetical protein